MIRFCELLARSFPPAGQTSVLRDLVGADDFAVLERLNVFIPADLDGRYPCPNRTLGDHCPRRVIHAPDLVAVCGNPSAQCDEVALTPDDLRRSQLSVQGFLSMLARALELRGKPSTRSEGHSMYSLGATDVGGRPRAYWFAPSARFFAFRVLAQGLSALAGARAAVLLIPTAEAVDPGDRVHAGKAGVEVMTLDEHLFRNAQAVTFELGGGSDRRVQIVGLPPRAGMSSNPHCDVLLQEGMRQLTREEYEKTLLRKQEFDLMIDMVDRPARGWVRREGSLVEQRITDHERRILIRLVRAGRPLTNKEFEPNPQSAEASFKTFRRMREKLDPVLPKGKMFLSDRAPGVSKTAQFARVRDLRWAVLLPREAEESEL